MADAAAAPPHPHAGAGGDDPAPIDPSQLLLGLPDLAVQCLVAHLAASDSVALVALLRASKESRALVVAHAPRATYTLSAGSGRMGRATLHAMAGRAGGDLELALMADDDDDDSGTQLAQLFTEAVQGGRWRAVRMLWIRVRVDAHGAASRQPMP
jgi:hypothetical protein